MLQIVSESSLSQAVVDRIDAGDDVILLAGTVWAAFIGHQDNPKLLDLLSRACRIHVLQDSLAMNGIENQQLLSNIETIDYAGFVELTVKNPVSHTWC